MDTSTKEHQTISITSPYTSSQTSENDTIDTIQINSTNSVKNKRKNFSPRCSTTPDEQEKYYQQQIDINNEANNIITTNNSDIASDLTIKNCNNYDNNKKIIKKINNCDNIEMKNDNIENLKINKTLTQQTNNFDTVSANWRLIFENHRKQIKNFTTTTTQNNSISSINDNNFSFYKIPNANTSKSTYGKNNIDEIPLPDPQSKIEFAYNAFNVVQELLNVYGLSISPGDIVDAFKKQAIGGCPQPLTPPRTPISSTNLGNQHHNNTNGNSIIPSTSNLNNSDCNEKNSLKDNDLLTTITSSSITTSTTTTTTTPETSCSLSTPLITLAPVSKLMELSASQKSDKKLSTIKTKTKLLDNNNIQNNNDTDDDSTTMDDDDDDEDDDDENDDRKKCNQSPSDNSYDIKDIINEQNDSLRPYDLSRFNDDSNISTDDNRHSDDQFSDVNSVPSTSTNDFDPMKLHTKTVENLCPVGFFSPILQQLPSLQLDERQTQAENVKYMKKFSSYLECKNEQCQTENLREHYHCYDFACIGKILSKKEEIIRHLKWHKKRNESINHGFLRFSSSDDCSPTFGNNCTHNRKQTHYHCFQPNCDKVYISTSDVQMHSNYHRKDSAIYQEGFQRFRATEECNADYCTFSGQRTTHFHCRRDNCRYTFKNKADMEKHKSYHIKDLQLARDGFKKFLKTEACPYERCRFSHICNHIHCVRENCYYVLHSSGQLLSHKRKHDRIDSEQAYRRFKMVQKAAISGVLNNENLTQLNNSKSSTPSTNSSSADMSPDLQQISFANNGNLIFPSGTLPPDLMITLATNKTNDKNIISCNNGIGINNQQNTPPIDLNLLYCNKNSPFDFLQHFQQRQQQILRQAQNNYNEQITSYDNKNQLELNKQNSDINIDDSILRSMIQNTNNDNINNITTNSDDIEQLIRQFFTDNCNKQLILSGQQQTEPLNLNLKNPDNNITQIECFMNTNDPHLHCLIKGCEAVIPHNLNDITEHMKMHELNRNADNIIQGSNLLQITSIEGFFNRKRGRPPKNRVVEVYNNTQQQSPQAIFTSFKLEKNQNDTTTASPAINVYRNQNTQLISPLLTSSGQMIGNYPLQNSPISSNNNNNNNNNNSTLPTTGTITPNETIISYLSDKKFKPYQDNEDCDENQCPYKQQMHLHCICNERCHFATKYGRSMDKHINEFHINSNLIDNFEYFERGFNCRIISCSSNKINSHFHCIKCQQMLINPAEVHLHFCTCNTTTIVQKSTETTHQVNSNNNSDVMNSLFINNNNLNNNNNNDSINISNDSHIINNVKTNNEQQNNFDNDNKIKIDIDMDNSLIKSESSEDERVSVVRAAGTYFPQNTDFNNKSPGQQNEIQQNNSNDGNYICQRPFCKLKKKLHQHCELCNQGFSDQMKLKIHRLKHTSTQLGQFIEIDNNDKKQLNDSKCNILDHNDDQPQDLTKTTITPLSLATVAESMATLTTTTTTTTTTPSSSSSPPSIQQQMLQTNFVDNFSMQNIHLAHLALYQQNPFYYQNFYPFIGAQNLQMNQSNNDLLQLQFEQTTNCGKKYIKSDTISPTFSLVSAAAVAAAAAAANVVATTTNTTNHNNLASCSSNPYELKNLSNDLYINDGNKIKRKSEEYTNMIDIQQPPVKKMNKTKGNNFKIFKDEPIPHGYLKFRFNEDCHFPNCGYRNRQSHFHCYRNDCYYSFCDKTRFVQHTARHERLDKLMGDDFKQFRANMRCGYDDCAYNKNLGQNNKSSHFHCLKCNFICSDTNKVVAHRRQHSKMEFIRTAGFRKVANNEKCSSGERESTTGECTYSLKQTHYHCLVCDSSVLSRAQLGSHRHRV